MALNDATLGQFGRDITAYPPGTQNPKLYTEFYQSQLEAALQIAEKDYKHTKYLLSYTIPKMNDTTITIQRSQAIPGTGTSINPLVATGDALLLNNGALLNINDTDSKKPVVIDRYAFRMSVYLWGLWGEFNDFQIQTGKYNGLELLIQQIPRAIIETKDTYARNVIISNSKKIYIHDTPTTDIDALIAKDVLTIPQAMAGGMMFANNTIKRRDTDKKDVSGKWADYANGVSSVMIDHKAPIAGFKADGDRYKLLLSVEAYNQLIADPLFEKYVIAGKTVASEWDMGTNTSTYDENGAGTAIFNLRLVKVRNTFQTVNTAGLTIDTAILLPEATFAKVELEGSGVQMFVHKFDGGVQDPLHRACSAGFKFGFNVAKATTQTAAITFVFVINKYTL